MWPGHLSGTVVVLFVLTAVLDRSSAAGLRVSSPASATPAKAWEQLITQAATLGLPTRFLRVIAPDFVTVEFEDLRAFAAEYHPAERGHPDR